MVYYLYIFDILWDINMVDIDLCIIYDVMWNLIIGGVNFDDWDFIKVIFF